MVFVVAAVVLVAILAVTNLVFTFGVIRRLKEHTELIARMNDPSLSLTEVMLAPGSEVGGYVAETVDGATVSGDDRAGQELVGFFSLGCKPCAERLPEFVAGAGGYAGGRGQVLAIVTGDDDEGVAASYVDRLGAVARVVREEKDGPLQKTFGVRGYPAICLVDAAGVVVTSGTKVPDLTSA